MYESPIKLMESELEMQLLGEIMRAVQRVGVDVDEEELLKALKYDRDQYKCGYDDGYIKAIDEFYSEVLNFEDYIEPIYDDNGILLYSGYDITDMVVKIKKKIKGEVQYNL